MKPGSVAIVGAAETDLGVLPEFSDNDLRAIAAQRALDDAGLTMSDVDGLACAVESPVEVAHYLGLAPRWFDGTSVGGCSFLVHVRHAAAAIVAGLCSTVLVVHGESGRSKTGKTPRPLGTASLFGQFERPYGVSAPVNMFTVQAMRFLHDTGTTPEQLASVPAMQSRWAQGNPRAWRRDRVEVADVLASPVIAHPFHKLECCVVTDGGGALVITDRARARQSGRPVHLLGAGEATESPLASMQSDGSRFGVFRRSGGDAFTEAGITPADVDHLMVYDAFAHLPLHGLEELGFVGRGEAGAFVAEGRTAPGGELPMNTNGGGLCYTHTGMYGMFAILESVRQLRGTAYAQVPHVELGVVLGVGGMFGAAATLVLANRLS